MVCRDFILREAQKGKQPGLSDSTIRGIHTMLRNALDRAVKERLIVRNPADDCIPPKIPKHEMKILPPEQIKSYLTAAESGIESGKTVRLKGQGNPGRNGGVAGDVLLNVNVT